MSYMTVTQRREGFRAILAGDQCVTPAPVFDAISAQMAEDLGFEVAFMTGPTASAAVLGAPNHFLALLSATELAQQVRRICRACSIPVVAVAEHGYGNALNIMRTVEELESVGVSALTIDDPALPFGFGEAQWGDRWKTAAQLENRWKLAPIEESVGKLKAAIAARQDPSLVIVARTRALHLPTGGLAEAVRRAKAYEQAGADAIFLPAKRRDEVEAVHAATRLPLLLGGHIWEDQADQEFLTDHGVRFSSPQSLTFWASVKAVYDTLKAIREGKTPADLESTQASPELKAQVTRQSRYVERMKAFMN